MTRPQRHDTDVLVIGGGLAGLRAALAARAEGASVAIAVKGKLGRSGCSAMTTAGYAAVVEGDPGDDVARYIQDTHRGGADLGDPVLVSAVCHEAGGMVKLLESEGALFAKDERGAFVRSPSGDHSVSRVLATPRNLGTDLTVPLAELLATPGVEVLEFTMVTELLVSDGRCVGARALRTRTGEYVAISCRSAVLATGGAGRLFSVTSNPNDVTGDGFALAARAGARLRDMEFIQFYPWRCIDPFDRSRVSIQPSTFVYGAKMYNADGERFMLQFNPDGAEITTRDVAARGIFEQMRSGKGVGGGVRLDLSPLDERTFEKSNPKVAKLLAAKGIDYRTYPFVVTPEAHFFMGGVDIDSDGAASIEGLYAAGEVAGGVHGANRLNSNALPETQVFGLRAGRAAARAAIQRGKDPGGAYAPAALTDLAFGGSAPAGAGEVAANDEELRARLAELQERMWEHLGIIRSADGLAAGLAFVRAARNSLPGRPVGGGSARAWYELVALYETAELCLTSALHRTESRGAHFREDFPSTNDEEWKVTVMLRRSDDGIDCFTRPLATSRRLAVGA